MNAPFTTSTESTTKQLFENIRNTLVCATVAVSGLAIAKYHELSVIGPQYAVWLGLAVTFASAILVLWNVLHGFKILRKNANIRSVWFWVVDIPGVMLYLLFTVSVWGAVAKLQANQLQFVTKQPPVITSLAPSNP